MVMQGTEDTAWRTTTV